MRALISLALLMACLPLMAAAPAKPHEASPMELAVYGAYLEQTYVKDGSDEAQASQRFIIRNEAQESSNVNRRAWEYYLARKASGWAQPSSATVQAFVLRPANVIQIYGFPRQKVAVTLLRSDVLDPLLAKGWGAFYAAYPGAGGVLSFSGIGFNPGQTEAMFTIWLQCGQRCAFRNLAFMKKTEAGVWELMWRQFLP